MKIKSNILYMHTIAVAFGLPLKQESIAGTKVAKDNQCETKKQNILTFEKLKQASMFWFDRM